jgi:hypothetical protein
MLMGEHAVADHELVLVVRADSDIEAIDLLDVRKVYLGFSVRTIKNAPIRAAANLTEKPIFEIFLQDVMAMSASTYDRRLLTLTLQSGYLRPAVFRNLTELVDALKQDPNTVSFMWKEDAEAAGELKVLRVLWRE